MTHSPTTPPQPFLFAAGTELSSMSGKHYRIDRQLRTGFHGCSYVALLQPPGTPECNAFIKTPYADLNQPPEMFQGRNSRIFSTFTAEYQNRHRLDDVPGVARVTDVGIYEWTDDTTRVPRLIPFLVQEYIHGIAFEDYLRDKFSSGARGFTGVQHQRDWFMLARKILEIVRRVHNRHVVHGDIWPPNILMVGDEPCLVDFGQSFLVDQSFHQGGGSTKPHPYLAPERESTEGRWYTPADIYAIGGLFFYMSTGKHPDKLPIHVVDDLKDYVYRTIKDRNPQLLKENMGISKIVDKCLRADVEDRYGYVENISNALDIFDYESSPAIVSDGNVAELLQEMRDSFSKLRDSDAALFAALAQFELSFLKKRIDAMIAGHHEILGEREELIDSLLRYLGVLGEGDEYLTVTVPAFWAETNLGINGRFLTMNKMMALRGVIIRRVFLLTEADRRDPNTMRILEAHARAASELAVEGVETHDKSILSSSPRSFYTGYALIEREARESLVRSAQHVAIWRKNSSEQLMSITFSPKPGADEDAARQIGKVRFWSSPRQQYILSDFRRRIEESRPLSDFLVDS